MIDGNFSTILVTLITVLGSSAAWEFYKKKMDMKKKEHTEEKAEKNLYRDDLKERVANLELLLQVSSAEKDKLRDKVIALTADVATLSTKVEFLGKEVIRLEEENNALKHG